MNLDALVKAHRQELGDNDRAIWRYLCDHREECLTASAESLAEACGVSPAAISRFCQKLGLEGYGELRHAVKWQTQESRRIDRDLITRTYQDYQLTLDYLKTVDYGPIIEFLNGPGRIFAYGTGEVQRNTAREFRRLMVYADKRVFVAEAMSELDSALKLVAPGDVFVVFSLSGNNKAANQRVRELRAKGIPILSVTSYEDNELARISDHHLYYYNHCILSGNGLACDAHLSAQFFMIVEVLLVKYLEWQGRQG